MFIAAAIQKLCAPQERYVVWHMCNISLLRSAGSEESWSINMLLLWSKNNCVSTLLPILHGVRSDRVLRDSSASRKKL